MFLVFLLLGISFQTTVSAEWDGLPFSPGTQDNPPCLPSQINCDVIPPLTSELDPIFIASEAFAISGIDIANWNGKQEALGFDPVSKLTTVNGHALSSDIFINASDIGLGNVVNESKATMFASPTLTGTISMNGNIDMTGNIIPTTNDTYALGSPTKVWKDLFVGAGSIYVNGQKVLQTDESNSVLVSASDTQNLIFQTTGGGNVEINSASGGGQILLKSNIVLTAGKTIRTSDLSSIIFSDGTTSGNVQIFGNTISSSNVNGGISISPNGLGNTYVTNGNFGVGTTSGLSKLSINGGLHVGGDSDAGDNNILADGTITGSNLSGINTGDNATNSQYSSLITSKQDTLNGVGLVRVSGGTVTYDNTNYVSGTPWTSAGYVTGTPWTSAGYITDGNTGWDNSYGFITGVTETDPTFSASSASGITGTNISNWNTAYGWGNHTSAGYLTSANISGLIPYTGGTSNVDLGIHNLTVDTNSLFVDSVNHRVGVGTTTPGANLNIFGNSIGIGPSLRLTNQTGANGSAANFDAELAGSIITNRISFVRTNSVNQRDSDTAFSTFRGSDNSLNEWLRINSVGNVGIGKTNPIRKLDVNGIIASSNESFVAGEGAIIAGGSNPTIVQRLQRAGGGYGYSLFSGYADNTVTGLSSKILDYGAYGSLQSGTTAPTIAYAYFGVGPNADLSNTSMRLYNDANKTVSFNGNVGIGTTTPAQKLHVVSGAGVLPSLGNQIGLFQNNLNATDNSIFAVVSGHAGTGAQTIAGIQFGDKDAINNGQIYYYNSDNSLAFGTDLTEKMRILSNGNIGVGTTNPVAKLEVVDTISSTNPVFRVTADNTNSATYGSEIKSLSGNRAALLVQNSASSGTGGVLVVNSVATTGNLFEAQNNGTPKFVIQQNGYVGIGTTNPTVKLVIQQADQVYTPLWTYPTGDIALGIAANTSSISGMDFKNFNTTGQVRLMARNDQDSYIATNIPGSAVTTAFFGQQGKDTALVFSQSSVNADQKLTIGTYNSGDLLFGTSNTERMRILNSGNVGIGTTTPTAQLTLVKSDSSALTDLLVNPTVKTSGRFLDLQVNGASKFSVDYAGNMVAVASVITPIVNTSFLRPNTNDTTLDFSGRSFTGSSGTQTVAQFVPTINQSGTAGWIGLLVNPTLTSIGSGPQVSAAFLGGSVGIGTNAPISTLQINSASVAYNNGNGTFSITNSTDVNKRLNMGYDTALGVNGSGWVQALKVGTTYTPLVLNPSGGNIGIGTTSPTANLEVNGAIKVGGTPIGGVNLDVTGTIRGTNFINSGAWITTQSGGNGSLGNLNGTDTYIGSTKTGGNLLLYSNNTEAMRILANGNVGIGTTVPSTKLHIQGAAVGTGLTATLENTDDTGNATAGFFLKNGAGNTARFNKNGSAYSFSIIGGNDTSIYNSSAAGDIALLNDFATGSIKFATGGATTPQVIIKSTGNVGIGVTNPTKILDVQAAYADMQVKSTTTTNPSIIRLINGYTSYFGQEGSVAGTLATNSLAYAGLYSTNANNLQFGTSSSIKMTIDTSGKVGVGTTGPVAKLEVKGAGGAFPAVSGITQSAGLIQRLNDYSDAVLDTGGNAGNGMWLQSVNRTSLSSNLPLLLNPNGGNVGIGTTNPMATLHINKANGEGTPTIASVISAIFQRNATSASQNDISILAGSAGLARIVFGDKDSSSSGIISYDNSNDSLNFTTNAFQKMIIDSTGNVGIGTTSPSAKLEVNGILSAGDSYLILSNSGTPRISFREYSSGLPEIYTTQNLYFNVNKSAGNVIYKTTGGMTFQLEGGTGQTNTFRSYNGNLNLKTSGVYYLAFTTNDNEAMRIDASGNVGIGITNPTHLLTMGTGGGFYDETTGAWIDGSDLNYKDNILSLDKYGLNTLNSLRPVSYNFKHSGVASVGFIAQEVKLLIPELVSGEDGAMGLNYGGFSPLIVKSIQELDLKLEGLAMGVDIITNRTFTERFYDKLIVWFGSADNGLEKICVKKADGTSFCADGDQLEKAVNGLSGGSAAPVPEVKPAPVVPAVPPTPVVPVVVITEPEPIVPPVVAPAPVPDPVPPSVEPIVPVTPEIKDIITEAAPSVAPIIEENA